MTKSILLIIIFIVMFAGTGCVDQENTIATNNTTRNMNADICSFNVSCNLVDINGGDNSDIQKSGDIITYNVILENTGNTNLTVANIVVDNQTVDPSVLGITNNIMEPGKIYTSIYRHVITNDEVYDDYKIDVSVCAEYSDSRIDHDVALTVPVKYKFTTRYIPSDYVDSNIDQTILYNNTSAEDITTDELWTFLEAENSNIASYMQGKQLTPIESAVERTVKTYNDAELAGIRSNFTIIHYTDNTIAICNAFNTVDGGLIYVDYTYGEYSLRENVAPGKITKMYDMHHHMEYMSFSSLKVDYIESL